MGEILLQGQMPSMDGAAVNLYYHLRYYQLFLHMDVNSVDKGGYKMLHNISPQ
jgi:hypothetical protein